MKQSPDCNEFSLFSQCPEKLTCFSSETEKYSKQIWGNWFAFRWCLKLFQAKAQAGCKVQHAGDRLKVNMWLSGMYVVNIRGW